MKKSLLCSALLCHGVLAMISSSLYAEPSALTADGAKSKQVAKPTDSSVSKAQATPASAALPQTATTPAQPINCNYHIPSETSHIDSSLVMQWAEKAAQQSFDFNHTTLDKQLTELKSCYTDPGWKSFYDALQKSGNIKAIQAQNLMVSSMVNGTPSVKDLKDNQWKVNLLLHVVYQNENEKLTQPLTVELLIGRKLSGDLGIMQIIASPPRQETSAVANTPTPSGQANASPVPPTGKQS
jgi:hypothetical protein